MSSLRYEQAFFEYIKLPSDLISAHNQVKDLAVRFVKSADEDTHSNQFDWGGFKTALDNQDAENITIGGFTNSPIPLQGDDATVSTMVDKIMNLLPSLLPSEPVDQSQMKNELNSSLADLDQLWDDGNQAGASGVLSEKWLSREYRVLAGVPAGQPNYLQSIVASVTVKGHFKKESTWGGLGRPKITKELDAAVKVMQLMVAKGFTNPS
ncbi:hypothetical protein BDZ94DRAFT_91359 [Collybia nuda]|uniref:Uncharacterized protein n=1 Tax=Collybia nuda TaxID=64659 RepID=A0A9P6CNF2_9AGAR|nr:hypothetical protein BDZ94DRAFT_91359 [Collybia nuda]